MNMETESINKSRIGKNVIIPVILLLAFLIYYTIMAMLSPVKKKDAITKEYSFIQDEKNIIDEQIFADSTYLKLLKEKSFLQSRIAMAETDSIYLTINLSDSIVSLEISGVAVHTSRVKRSDISKILKSGNEYIISSMLARPFTIEKNYSSIPKEPLMIKMAPKDTSEYQPDIIPDTADYEPVNFIMQIENGFHIFIYQDEKLNFGDGIHRLIFDMLNRFRDTFHSLKSVVTFRIPEYHPYIKVRLPRTDAKIIYRALPEHGQIAVYL